MAKQLKYGEDARRALENGINALAIPVRARILPTNESADTVLSFGQLLWPITST